MQITTQMFFKIHRWRLSFGYQRLSIWSLQYFWSFRPFPNSLMTFRFREAHMVLLPAGRFESRTIGPWSSIHLFFLQYSMSCHRKSWQIYRKKYDRSMPICKPWELQICRTIWVIYTRKLSMSKTCSQMVEPMVSGFKREKTGIFHTCSFSMACVRKWSIPQNCQCKSRKRWSTIKLWGESPNFSDKPTCFASS